jgi:O-antigen/teichoic acid export membrane protein
LRSVFDDAGAFLTALGKPHLVSRYLVVQALIILFTTPLLTYFWGVNGAAVSLNVVLGVGLLLAYYYVNRFVTVDFAGIFLQGLLPSFLAAIIFVAFLARFWPALTLFSLLLKFLVVVGLYLFLLILTEGRALRDEIRFLGRMMRK